MTKRWWMTLVCCVGLTLAFAAQAADPYRVYVVTWRGVTAAEEGFMSYFQERGIPTEFVLRDAARDHRRLETILAEIRRERPDLVYAFGTTAALRLVGSEGNQHPEDHLVDIPVIFNIVADPTGANLISDLAGSGRNLTGTSHLVPVETQFNALRALGDYDTVGAIYNPLEANSTLTILRLEDLMAQAGIELIKAPIPHAGGAPRLSAVPEVVRRLADGGAQIVYLPSDSFLISNADAVVSEIHRHGLPTFSATESPIREAGALIGIVSNYFTVGRFAGYKAERILVDGEDPGVIPIETLARFTFLVNLETMRRLQHYPPVTVLQFAEVVDETIEASATAAANP